MCRSAKALNRHANEATLFRQHLSCLDNCAAILLAHRPAVFQTHTLAFRLASHVSTNINMRASNVGPTLLLLLASTVVAQTNTENVYTIQTSTPTGTATCFEVCVQEPCYACAHSTGIAVGQ